MKTRIIKDSYGSYMVQIKYKYRPFWIDDTEGVSAHINRDIRHSSLVKAKKRELEIHRRHNYKKMFKIIK